MKGEQYDEDTDYSDEDLDALEIIGNKMEDHKTLRVFYTTYDMRRESDVIKPVSDGADVMLLSGDSDERVREKAPFWYARVIGINSVKV